MKRILSLVLAVLCLCQPICAFGAFDEAIEDSQEKKETHKEESKPKKNSPNSSARDSAEGSLIQFFAEIFAYVWIINAYARYYPYPYSYNGTKYVAYDGISADSADFDDFASPLRRQRFSFDSSLVYLKGLAVGNESNFDCMLYPLIGFYAKNLILFDHIHNEGNMGNINLGANLPIFQTNFLSLYLKFGWSRWYNEVTPLLKDNAFFLGGELKSYPFKPLSLKWTFGWQFYENDIFVYDSDLQAGILINRLEIFAGWKYLRTGTTNSDSSHWNGFDSGIRVHF